MPSQIDSLGLFYTEAHYLVVDNNSVKINAFQVQCLSARFMAGPHERPENQCYWPEYQANTFNMLLQLFTTFHPIALFEHNFCASMIPLPHCFGIFNIE
ncbi:hypothetical protein TNIN_289101 [Trichonephila inaurata madagascariensis]|uniref:Uncharacterized protein n=1 Tax=Trichonephila inaurata madagascariensis TaxID=2747483 RepID=A0A8X6YB66_9ARAC|nr:hypothetical protein TNIN_289101 [Trichonephila inaurata madagascariensis]